MARERLHIFDTTMRDGQQTAGGILPWPIK